MKDICYLCGQTMIEKKGYLKKDIDNELPKFKHDEHIIQNALYGRLKAPNILCEKCGSKLSKSIDTDFVKIFDLFTSPISHILASKDHGENGGKTLTGYIKKSDGTKIEVQVKDGKIVPKKPDFDFNKETNTVKIYGAKKILDSFQKKVLQDLEKEGHDTKTISLELIDHISDWQELGINFSQGIENFNEKFKLGLNKIATGFASLHGIKRTDMPCTIDTENEQIIFTTNVLVFYPVGTIDKLMEPVRSVIEDGFPTHTLMLYTDRSFGNTRLVCYIDLFSTFQYYVILNDNFKGPEINKTYYQTIIKQEKPDINIRDTRPKYLNILIEELGVDREEIRGMKLNEIYDFLETKQKQYTVKYVLDINSYVRKVSSLISKFILLKNHPQLEELSFGIEKEIINAIPELEVEELLCLQQEFHRIENISPEEFYKKEYITFDRNNNNNKRMILYSTLMRLFELNRENFNVRDYTFSKFFLLQQFVNSNSEK